MGKRLLSVQGGTALYLHDEQDGKCAIETVADLTTALERAKARHNAGFHRTGMGDSHTASIPMRAIADWAALRGKTFKDVMDDSRLMDLFLLDRDNSGWIIDPTSLPNR